MKTIVHSIMVFLAWGLPLYMQGVEYIVQDVGTVTAAESHVTGINHQNSVVGYIQEGGITSDFIWTQDSGLFLLPHLHYQSPLINNSNHVVNIFWHLTNYWFATNIRSKHIYIYDNGLSQDIGAPDQWEIQQLEEWKTPSIWDNKNLGIVAFNDNQQILVANAKQSSKATQFAIWQNGVFQKIDADVIAHAYDMNNQGIILGRKWVESGCLAVPALVLYNPTTGSIVEIMSDLNLMTRKLNDQGQVIACESLYRIDPKGFLWDPEKGLVELKDMLPIAFNNLNQIVGLQTSKLDSKKIPLLLWDSGEPSPIVLQETGIELLSIKAINDNGYMIGDGLFDGKEHGFMLIPQNACSN